MARFEREAKLLASLNHPNIASIYGFESQALVLEPSFRASPPEAMFEVPTAFGQATYDITPDGQRFVMLRGDAAAFRELHVVPNWTEELKRLVPTE